MARSRFLAKLKFKWPFVTVLVLVTRVGFNSLRLEGIGPQASIGELDGAGIGCFAIYGTQVEPYTQERISN